MRSILIWVLVLAATLVPLAAALNSPYLAYRDPIYIAAGIAGILALGTLLFQPLLAMNLLPGLRGRRIHHWTGAFLTFAIFLHVAGLWVTSPPDVIDALTFTAPTPFSAWGVIAMWAVFLSALLAASRKQLQIGPRTWRLSHTGLAVVIVAGSSIHALLIEGTMEVMTKTALCALVLIATAKAIARTWTTTFRR